MKEYTYTELSRMFQAVGFAKTKSVVGGKGIFTEFPILPLCLLETILAALPCPYRNRIARLFPFRLLLEIRIVGVKSR